MSPSPVVVSLTLMLTVQTLLALVPIAAACEEAVCATDEEARHGGDCGPEDGRPAHYSRYYNVTIQVGEVRIRSTSTFACENQQPVPWVSDHHEKMWANVTRETPGRVDNVKVLYTYGEAHNGCSAGAGVFLDRVLIFNDPSVGEGASSSCGGANRIPSVAEALP